MICAHFRPREEKKFVKKILFTRPYLNQRFCNQGPQGFILAEFEARSFFDYFHVQLIFSRSRSETNILFKLTSSSESLLHVHQIRSYFKLVFITQSYVANFHTQMGSSQSEERAMFFTREKNDTPNQNNARGVFSRVQKNDTSNQSLPSFVPEFSPFIGFCSFQRHCFFRKLYVETIRYFFFFAQKSKKTNIPEIRVEQYTTIP